jgi:hypothetical protein
MRCSVGPVGETVGGVAFRFSIVVDQSGDGGMADNVAVPFNALR